jgi:hypothetical protein
MENRSEGSEILTDEEIAAAIHEAREKKAAKLREIAYWERVNAKKQEVKPTAPQLLQSILKMAKEANPSFKLTEEERNIYTMLSEYFTNDIAFEKRDDSFSLKKGNMIYGNVGCGKTTLFKLFAANPKQSYAIATCREIQQAFSSKKNGGYDAIVPYFGNPTSSRLDMSYNHRELGICFDDLGTENGGMNFGQSANVMAEVLLTRYERGSGIWERTHISTNLSADQIEEFYGARVRSRAREMFNQIHFPIDSTDKR